MPRALAAPNQSQNPSCASGLYEVARFEQISGSGTVSKSGVSVTFTASKDGGAEATAFSWTSSTPIDQVITKAGDSAKIDNYNEATSGTGTSPDSAGISHITFCADVDPIPATASVNAGTCVFNNGQSRTPVTASISPSGAATISLTKIGDSSFSHTFTNGTSINVSPGTYNWVATAKPGYVLTGATSGSITALSCAPIQPQSASTSVSPGACVFTNAVSQTPVTASISPAGSATILLTKVGDATFSHTFTNGTPINVLPGTYKWVATAAQGFTITGASTGTFTALACNPLNPQSVTVSMSTGPCTLVNGQSRTPATASISPAGAATILLTKVGDSSFSHTFTDGTPLQVSPGTYNWVATAAQGYTILGASSGTWIAAACNVPGPQPSASASTTCVRVQGETGALFTLRNDGTSATTFTLSKNGATLDTIQVNAGNSVTRVVAMAEDETATFKVAAAGMDTLTSTLTLDCIKVLGEKSVRQVQGAVLAKTGLDVPMAPSVIVALLLLALGTMLLAIDRVGFEPASVGMPRAFSGRRSGLSRDPGSESRVSSHRKHVRHR